MTESASTPFVIGSSFHNTPLGVLEKIAVGREDLQSVVKELAGWLDAKDLTLLSTCNRTEIIGTTRDVRTTRQQIVTYFNTVSETTSLQPENLYTHTGIDAVTHLFRVVSGLDSMIVGETEIVGQLQYAFGVSQCEGLAGNYFVQLFDAAFRTNKRVRKETGIDRGTTSIAKTAVHVARRILGDLSNQNTLIIGAGETGSLAGTYLSEAQATIYVANRTHEKAVQLAQQTGGNAVSFDKIEDVLSDVNAVLLATGAKSPLVTREMVARVQKKRKGQLLLVVDISLPHNAEPEIAEVGNVFLFNMDDLKNMVAKSLSQRVKEKEKADAIISDEVAAFFARQRALEVGPLIAALRRSYEEIYEDELQRYENRLCEADKEVFEQFARSLVNKLLHQPTMGVRALADDEETPVEKAKWFEKLFGLDKPKDERMRNK